MSDDEQVQEVRLPAEVRVRNLAKRELDIRLMAWGDTASTFDGIEEFARSAFDDTDPKSVLLMGLEHEVHLGAAQDGRVVPVRRPQGRGTNLEITDREAVMTFRVAQTQAGDEILALAAEDIVNGASVEMGKNARVTTDRKGGRRRNIVEWADLRAVSPTYQPAYAGSRVVAVRSQQEEPVSDEKKTAEEDEPKAPETPTVNVQTRSAGEADAIDKLAQAFNKSSENILDRLEKIEERSRSGFVVPGPEASKPKVTKGDWASVALRLMAGERVPDAQMRLVADVISSDNLGILPDTHSSELIGVIDARRPFLNSTRKLSTPETGLNIVVPKITQRPTTGVQSADKTELSSEHTIITTETFAMVTIGGVGDISLQLLKRADRNFLDLYLELLAEAYAIDAEDGATDALIAAIADGGPEPAGALDPNDLTLGAAWEASFDAIRRGPDTIWMSSGAVSAFLDAKADGTNMPLYGQLGAAFNANAGPGGGIQGLRPVHVPALDTKGAYAIVGPSSGFAWAEDGTFTLSADIPSKAGRDVALVGMLWFAPYYPAAFTLFNVAS